LLQEATEQERTKQELDVARRIQTSFLPECCPDTAGWELATVWRSARKVSGDFYDFFPLPPTPEENVAQPARLREGRTGVVIADVADKGVPAALFMPCAAYCPD
jgi:sigma-B regulation protein RsbU (phosphoserine phosphatase)